MPFFQKCAVALYFSKFPKLAFFRVPHSVLGSAAGHSTPPMAKVAFGIACCFSILFAAAFLVAGGVASSVSSLVLLLGIFRFLFLTFSRRRRQRWPLRRQPRPRGRGRGPKCPPFSRACFRAANGQQEYGIQNAVLWLKEVRHSRKSKNQKQSVALKEEYTKKTKMKTAPAADPGARMQRPCLGRWNKGSISPRVLLAFHHFTVIWWRLHRKTPTRQPLPGTNCNRPACKFCTCRFRVRRVDGP